VAAGLIAWGLIQRFRGSPPAQGNSPRARSDDQAEGLVAIASGVVMALSVLAYWWFT
jgi:hypothetical protein